MTRRILRLRYGSSFEHEYLTISSSPGGIAEATLETAAEMRKRRGADWAEWLDGAAEVEAIEEMALEAQRALRHKRACDEGACAPGCPIATPRGPS